MKWTVEISGRFGEQRRRKVFEILKEAVEYQIDLYQEEEYPARITLTQMHLGGVGCDIYKSDTPPFPTIVRNHQYDRLINDINLVAKIEAGKKIDPEIIIAAIMQEILTN